MNDHSIFFAIGFLWNCFVIGFLMELILWVLNATKHRNNYSIRNKAVMKLLLQQNELAIIVVE